MKELLGYERLPQIAVSAGSATPDPGGASAAGVLAWSVPDSAALAWNGSAWSSLGGAAAKKAAPIQVFAHASVVSSGSAGAAENLVIDEVDEFDPFGMHGLDENFLAVTHGIWFAKVGFYTATDTTAYGVSTSIGGSFTDTFVTHVDNGPDGVGSVLFFFGELNVGNQLAFSCDPSTGSPDLGDVFVHMERLSTEDVICALRATGLAFGTTEAAIAFAATDILDPQSMHDPASNNTHVTIGTPGTYEVWANVSDDNQPTISLEAWLRLNGTTAIGATSIVPVANIARVGASLCIGENFAANDYIELMGDASGTTAASTAALFVRKFDAADIACVLKITGLTSDSGQAAISFTADDLFDPQGLHDPSSNADRITIKHSGMYECYGNLYGSTSAGGMELVMTINGTVEGGGSNAVGFDVSNASSFWCGWLDVGDIVRFLQDCTTGSIAGLECRVVVRKRDQ